MAPIQTAKSNIGAMLHTVQSTNAGALSHSARLTLGNMRANGVRSLDVTTGDVSPPGGLGRSLCWSYSV
jgi:hypothetical protein